MNLSHIADALDAFFGDTDLSVVAFATEHGPECRVVALIAASHPHGDPSLSVWEGCLYDDLEQVKLDRGADTGEAADNAVRAYNEKSAAIVNLSLEQAQ